jgi:hypothetical protein
MTGASERAGTRVAFLKALSGMGNQPLREYEVLSMVRGETGVSFPTVLRPYPWVTAVWLEREIKRADSTGVVVEVFGQSLAKFLERYLTVCGSIRADASVFDQVWVEYVEDQSRTSIPYRYEGLLRGLSGTSETLILDPRVRIHTVNDEWKIERCESELAGLALVANHGVAMATCNYVLEMDLELQRGPYGLMENPETIADQVVTALRLSSPGGVGLVRSWVKPTVPVFFAPPFDGFLGLGRAEGFLKPGMEWQGDPEVLRALFQAVRRGLVDDRLNLALRRFESSYCEREPEDRLVDYWIALESVFLPEQRTELSHLGPLRIALWIETTAEGRKAMFGRMRASYKARSEIVHGEKTADLAGIEADTEDALRRALRRMVVRGRAPSKAEWEQLELGAA